MDGGDGRLRQEPLVISPTVPLWTRDATLAMVVKHFAPTLLRRVADDPVELARLQTLAYSEAVFGLDHPFLRSAAGLPSHLEPRYFVEEHLVREVGFRVTNRWPPRLRPRFLAYLTGRTAPVRPPLAADPPRFAFAEEANPFVITVAPAEASHRSGAREAEEAFVRHVLARLSPNLAGDSTAIRAVLDSAARDLAGLADRTVAELREVAVNARGHMNR